MTTKKEGHLGVKSSHLSWIEQEYLHPIQGPNVSGGRTNPRGGRHSPPTLLRQVQFDGSHYRLSIYFVMPLNLCIGCKTSILSIASTYCLSETVNESLNTRIFFGNIILLLRIASYGPLVPCLHPWSEEGESVELPLHFYLSYKAKIL